MGGENFPVSVFYPLCEHLVEGKEQVPVAVRRKLRRVSLLSPQARPFGTDAWVPHAPNVPDLRETGHPIAMPSMGTDDARRSLTSARVATLATARASGEIDLVPITFAVYGNQLVSVVDHKPKTTLHLRRLKNIMNNPRVTVLAHSYDEEWDRLWWVRVRGTGRIVTSGRQHHDAIRSMVAKYPQLVDPPPTGSVIIVEIDEWLGWSARQS